MRKRIGIVLHGGIGGGEFSQGLPIINEIAQSLSTHYEIGIYTLLAPNPGFICSYATMHTPPAFIKNTSLRWLYLGGLFFFHNIKKKYHLLYAFWGYPAGLVAVVLGKLLGKPTAIHLHGGDSTCLPELQYGVFL